MSPMNERTIFMAALEHEDLAQQSAYLDKECAGNPKLRERVEALLRSHRVGGELLSGRDARNRRHHRVPPIAERPGTQIGPYKLLQEIGEGGMGMVYMALQKEPVRRKWPSRSSNREWIRGKSSRALRQRSRPWR